MARPGRPKIYKSEKDKKEANKKNRAASRSRHYSSYLKYQLQYQKQHRRKIKQKAIELFGSVCLDCKQSYPLSVYDFHHLDPETKDVSIKTLYNSTWDKLEIELKKCVLLCANCHRIRHEKQNGNDFS